MRHEAVICLTKPDLVHARLSCFKSVGSLQYGDNLAANTASVASLHMYCAGSASIAFYNKLIELPAPATDLEEYSERHYFI